MDVQQAIGLALNEVKTLFAGGRDHRLEEVELKDGGATDVTISYRTEEPPMLQPLNFGSGFPPSPRRAAIGVDASRLYKLVTVGSDGVVKAVRIRQIVLG